MGVLGLIVYGLSQTSSIVYTDDDIQVVDFSALDSKQKRGALEAVNKARCTCNCGMTLAQCVVTDSTCPLRASNVDRIKGMVEHARSSRSVLGPA